MIVVKMVDLFHMIYGSMQEGDRCTTMEESRSTNDEEKHHDQCSRIKDQGTFLNLKWLTAGKPFADIRYVNKRPLMRWSINDESPARAIYAPWC
jgi:hypothetical protein